jgi:uncharacterized protein YecE (DUF72 family)
MALKPGLMIGTAGWSVPGPIAVEFPDVGSHLARYSAVFNAVEINSSFYRAHRKETYAKWAAIVPSAFRFSVKLPREITHDLRLRASAKPLGKFLREIDGLGSNLGCLLIQLPPSLTFERAPVRRFMGLLRRHFLGSAVIEPRHLSWFEPSVEEELREFDVNRVGSDPALCAAAAKPLSRMRSAYYRLHGSPHIYYSNYDEPFLESLATELTSTAARASERWCIFDNTARGFAAENALRLLRLLRPV